MDGKMDYGPPSTPPEAAAQFYTSKYIRNSRAVAILWGVFTVCSAILNIVVFVSPHWVGDTDESKGPGNFGLWRFCTVLSSSSSDGNPDSAFDGGSVVCIGDLTNFASILSPAFRAATVFVALSVIVIVLCVVAFLLFLPMRSHSVFEICGTMQFLSGICLAIGILAFPAGWDNDHVRGICGPNSTDYGLGDCGVRWAFVLAVIAFFDCWILGILAFTLAHRTVRPTAMAQQSYNEPHYMNPASIYRGEYNSGFIGDSQSLSGSRKSLGPLQPVMMMPHPGNPGPPPPMHQDDGYSEFGHRNGNGGSPPYNRSPYGAGQPNIQNFQL
jgi:hypothetical protein